MCRPVKRRWWTCRIFWWFNTFKRYLSLWWDWFYQCYVLRRSFTDDACWRSSCIITAFPLEFVLRGIWASGKIGFMNILSRLLVSQMVLVVGRLAVSLSSFLEFVFLRSLQLSVHINTNVFKAHTLIQSSIVTIAQTGKNSASSIFLQGLFCWRKVGNSSSKNPIHHIAFLFLYIAINAYMYGKL